MQLLRIAFPELVTLLQKFQIHRIPDVDHQLGKSRFPGSWLYVINSNLITTDVPGWKGAREYAQLRGISAFSRAFSPFLARIPLERV